MIKMKKILLILLLGMFLISSISAIDDQGTGTQGQNFTLVQTCDDATYITLSTLQFPNRSVLSINTNMTSIGGGAFQFNFTNIVLGRHDVTGISDGCTKTFATFFEVTPTGSIIEKPEASFYFIIVFSVLLLFALFLTIGIVTPFGNKKEETREGTAITGISLKKYLKVISLWIAYGFFLWFIVIISGIANNYIFFEGLRGMIFSLSLYLNTLGYGVNIFVVFLLLWMTWKDIVLNKKIINQGKVLLSELSR
ncbi:hypothetical protein LCGC14_0924760 [marine sediment metagenome]|uniref:Uncharacterized protein n=1 Tax=marine sediment metagenome TaxID=412755 RepID=A0A0F9R8H5_9ZZZZ